MAKLFLAENGSFTLVDSVQVFGAAGKEMIKIAGSAGAIIDQGVERVEFNEVLANYTLALGGNVLTVSLNGLPAAIVTVQGNGTKLAFADGSADIKLTGLSLGQLGGAFVDNNDAKIIGAKLDGFDPSTFGGSSTLKAVQVSATGIDNAGNNNVEDASGNDVSFDFSQGSYKYTVENFAEGDTLNFLKGDALSITNAGVDGRVDIIATDGRTGTSVEVTLTGISSAIDSTIFSVDGFTAAFGADSLIA